jgi:hypothetical protein
LFAEYSIVLTETGTRMLICNGYRFGLRKAVGTKIWWRCVRHTRNCKSMALMIDGTLVTMKEHNHSNSPRVAIRRPKKITKVLGVGTFFPNINDGTFHGTIDERTDEY